jgi:hypothetical protein
LFLSLKAKLVSILNITTWMNSLQPKGLIRWQTGGAVYCLLKQSLYLEAIQVPSLVRRLRAIRSLVLVLDLIHWDAGVADVQKVRYLG